MNSFSASILRVERKDSLCLLELDASGITLCMVLFDLDPSFCCNCRVNILFKETEVILSREPMPKTTIINCFPATIRTIRAGQILADIGMHCAAGAVSGIISRKALDRLQFTENETVTVLIKADQLTLETVPENGECV